MVQTCAAVVVGAILTLSVLTVMSSTKQAFAQAKSTELVFSASWRPSVFILPKADPSGTAKISLAGTLYTDCNGTLGCSSKVAGATIQIIGTGTGVKHVTTDERGFFHTDVLLEPGTHHIEAHYSGDSQHESSSWTKTVRVEPP